MKKNLIASALLSAFLIAGCQNPSTTDNNGTKNESNITDDNGSNQGNTDQGGDSQLSDNPGTTKNILKINGQEVDIVADPDARLMISGDEAKRFRIIQQISVDGKDNPNQALRLVFSKDGAFNPDSLDLSTATNMEQFSFPYLKDDNRLTSSQVNTGKSDENIKWELKNEGDRVIGFVRKTSEPTLDYEFNLPIKK